MSQETRDLLAEEADREKANKPLTLRQFAEEVCCLTDLSPLMKAIMDAATGVPVTTIDEADCETHFGCRPNWLPKRPSRTVAIRAGGRAGKTSRIAACVALFAAWMVPAPLLARNESAYVTLVAPTIKLARQALSFVKGRIEDSPLLSAAKVSDDSDHVGLRRPDGNVARIEVFAAGRGGAQLRAKTLVGAVFDESAFFRDESTGVICDTELWRAVIPRLVPGGQCYLVSTPWVLGVGLLEEFISKNWGTHENALAVTAPTKALFPGFDPDGSIEADMRANDEDNWLREIMAIPLAAGSQQFFSHEAIKASVNSNRPEKLERDKSATYSFGGDIGLKRNSSALVVAAKHGERYKIACIEELRPTPGLPLSPAVVMESFSKIINEYGGGAITVDSHERDAVTLEAARHHVGVLETSDKVESYILVRKLLHEGKIELPNNQRFVRQLRDVIAKPTAGGHMTITSPRKADGSHGDLVSAFIAAVYQASLVAPYKMSKIRSSRY